MVGRGQHTRCCRCEDTLPDPLQRSGIPALLYTAVIVVDLTSRISLAIRENLVDLSLHFLYWKSRVCCKLIWWHSIVTRYFGVRFERRSFSTQNTWRRTSFGREVKGTFSKNRGRGACAHRKF
jgi:hypothetical protein